MTNWVNHIKKCTDLFTYTVSLEAVMLDGARSQKIDGIQIVQSHGNDSVLLTKKRGEVWAMIGSCAGVLGVWDPPKSSPCFSLFWSQGVPYII